MNNNLGQDKNLLKYYLRLCHKSLAYNFVFSFFINVFMLATSIYSLQILDRVLSSGSLETLIVLSVIMIAIYIILAFLQIIRCFIFHQISAWLDSKLSSTLLESSIAFDNDNRGSQNLRDLATIKGFFSGQVINSIFDAPWAMIYFGVIFLIHWINGFIVLGGAVLLLALALLNEKLTKQQVQKANQINIVSMKKVESISRNAEVIKAMNMRQNIVNIWQEINKKLNIATNNAAVRSTVISNITRTIRMLIQMATMAVGAILVINNQMSAGGIIATSILSGKALAPFDAAVNIHKTLINVLQAYKRLLKALQPYEDKADKIELPAPQGKLSIEKVIYKLPNSDRLIIQGININIDPGQIIAVIGPSGAGKTTFARLVCGVLKPSKGVVRLDDAQIDVDNSKVGDYIGYLPQDIELFNGTVKDNIARMDKNADSQAIIAAAHFTNVHELILRLPEGYETNAADLSAGQRQRIALARAFYGESRLVILDEPNSNLDTSGEAALLETINNARNAQITVIIISHRPSLLNSVDKILVLQDGEAKIFDDKQKVIESLSAKRIETSQNAVLGS